MSRYQLAQLNIAKMKFAIDDPGMADFVARLDDINALADSAPGFVWRLQTEDGDATAIDELVTGGRAHQDSHGVLADDGPGFQLLERPG